MVIGAVPDVVGADADEIESDPDPRQFIAGMPLIERRDFQIRLANRSRRTKTSVLVERLFAKQGYTRDWLDDPVDDDSEITFQACRGDTVFGTLTLCLDSEARLPADVIYEPEIDAYRNAGARVCQLTRLAVEPAQGSRPVLGALFHAAYAFGGLLRGMTDVFIEVHPHHLSFYERILNFRLAGELRYCPRVDAPATLLHVGVDYVTEQVARNAGRHRAARGSLYPYFLSEREGEALAHLLLSVFPQTVALSQHFPERYSLRAPPRRH